MLSFKMKKHCELKTYDYKTDPFVIVIFGGYGDLSKRKLIPSLYDLFKLKKTSDFEVIAYGRREYSVEDYRNIARESVLKYAGEEVDEKLLEEFISKLYFVQGNFGELEDYKRLEKNILELKTSENKQVVFYLASPPQAAESILANLKELELCKDEKVTKKIILEKPFGVNKATSIELNEKVHEVFSENEIYRIDHYLGKETVQNILFFRFGNSIFEPLWNRNYIDHVQITVAEDIGIENRGNFYEGAGVVRDIVQNHLLQLVGLVGMEAPTSFDADIIRGEKSKVFKSIVNISEEELEDNFVKGQYGPGIDEEKKAYRSEEGVSKESKQATFFSGKFFIDNWRWAGVPFYVRAGKRLKQKVTEVYIQFKTPPLKLFGDECNQISDNGLLISIQPEEKISLTLNMKYPGVENHPHPVNMDFNYSSLKNISNLTAYERLIIDCLKGDLTLFARQDEIEELWRIVDPINEYFDYYDTTKFPNYFSGTWGPEKANQLIEKDGRTWRLN